MTIRPYRPVPVLIYCFHFIVSLVSDGQRLYMAYVADAMSDRTLKDKAHLLRAVGVFIIQTIPPPPVLPVQFNHSFAWSGSTWLNFILDRLTAKFPLWNSIKTGCGS